MSRMQFGIITSWKLQQMVWVPELKNTISSPSYTRRSSLIYRTISTRFMAPLIPKDIGR